jgi:hypothetical protein
LYFENKNAKPQKARKSISPTHNCEMQAAGGPTDGFADVQMPHVEQVSPHWQHVPECTRIANDSFID